jgi:hypothetical protein
MKNTFAAKTFASRTYASGAWAGVGVDVVTVSRAVIARTMRCFLSMVSAASNAARIFLDTLTGGHYDGLTAAQYETLEG